MDPRSRALIDLGRALRELGYAFTTVTPETQRIVNARRENARAKSLRDVFGWSRPFDENVVPRALVSLLRDAGALASNEDGAHRSNVRFSTLGPHLFVHSAYPTHGTNDVFFGPDTVRFCALIDRELAGGPRVARLVDVGCGAGAGGIVAKRYAAEVVLADVNAEAIRFAEVNAALAGIDVVTARSDVLAGVEGAIDCVIANPPYMRDALGRAYRDGGGDCGEALAVRIVEESIARLAPNGKLVLYTGAAVIDGEDVFLRAAKPILARAAVSFRYDEIDPDVFGDELVRAGYERVERIAAVALVVSMK